MSKEITTLDAVVDKYGLKTAICSNKSKHVDRGMNIPSDMMFEHDTMFLVKRIAFMDLGLDSEKIREWSPQKCKETFHEHNMGKLNSFRDTFLLDGKSNLKWYFQGRSDYYIRFLEYRWDNNMVFTSYSERVDQALQTLIDDETTNTSEIIDRIRDLEDQKHALNNELESLVASEGVSDRLKAILSNVNIKLSSLDD